MAPAVAPWAECSGLWPHHSLEALEKGEWEQEVIWEGKESCELCLWEAGRALLVAGGAWMHKPIPALQ